MFRTLDINGSALLAQRMRMDTIAQNLANIRTTHDKFGRVSPYQRRIVIFQEGRPEDHAAPGVHATIGQDDNTRLEYDPGHQDADSSVYVHYPDVDLSLEYVTAMAATGQPTWSSTATPTEPRPSVTSPSSSA